MRKKLSVAISLLTALIFIAGLTLLFYPTGASWINQYFQSREIAKVQVNVPNLYPEAAEQLASAHAYNEALASGAVLGASEHVAKGSGDMTDTDVEPYEQQLMGSPDGFMGRVRVDSAGIDLPIYHGTDDETLLKGAGHLRGTSLPVGGINTRTVVTAHRGLAESTLFTHLDKVKKGDIFTFEVLGEIFAYQVADIKVVAPEDTEAIRPVEGKDLATLITCTPIGVNSHRILVTGERIHPTPKNVEDEAKQPSGQPSFPWWAIAYGALNILIIVFTVRRVIATLRDGKRVSREEKQAIRSSKRAARAEKRAARADKQRAARANKLAAREEKPAARTDKLAKHSPEPAVGEGTTLDSAKVAASASGLAIAAESALSQSSSDHSGDDAVARSANGATRAVRGRDISVEAVLANESATRAERGPSTGIETVLANESPTRVVGGRDTGIETVPANESATRAVRGRDTLAAQPTGSAPEPSRSSQLHSPARLAGVPGEVADATLVGAAGAVAGGVSSGVASAVSGASAGAESGKVASAVSGDIAGAVSDSVVSGASAGAVPGGVSGSTLGSVASAVSGDIAGAVSDSVVSGASAGAVPGETSSSPSGRAVFGGYLIAAGNPAPIANHPAPLTKTVADIARSIVPATPRRGLLESGMPSGFEADEPDLDTYRSPDTYRGSDNYRAVAEPRNYSRRATSPFTETTDWTGVEASKAYPPGTTVYTETRSWVTVEPGDTYAPRTTVHTEVFREVTVGSGEPYRPESSEPARTRRRTIGDSRDTIPPRKPGARRALPR
uniref:class C sortase n=1 Tax=Vaginimicrobium propionicum TaxID=1871034 RepID=UPI0012EB36C3|nr:class C sortase [Vaginimicrobium propionicum]